MKENYLQMELPQTYLSESFSRPGVFLNASDKVRNNTISMMAIPLKPVKDSGIV